MFRCHDNGTHAVVGSTSNMKDYTVDAKNDSVSKGGHLSRGLQYVVSWAKDCYIPKPPHWEMLLDATNAYAQHDPLSSVETEAAAEDTGPHAVWIPHLITHIASFLPPNDIACSLRLVDKATASLFTAPQYTTVHLSQPVGSQDYARRWDRPGSVNALTLRQRQQLLCLTAASGNLTNLEVVVRIAGCVLACEVLEAAAAAGQLEVCKWLCQRGCPPSARALAAAAQHGHTAVCDWLLAQKFLCRDEAAIAAALGGRLDLVKAMLQPEQQPPRRPMGHARKPGLSDSGFSRIPALITAAAEGCSLEGFVELWNEWVTQRGGEVAYVVQQQRNQRLIRFGYGLRHGEAAVAAAAGSLTPDWQAKVEWLEAHHCPRSPAACNAAAACPLDPCGRLAWLRERDYPLEPSAAVAAISAGNLPALRYLLSCGVRPDPDTAATAAASRGQLEVLLVLLEAGCLTLTHSVLLEAARCGSMEVVRWALRELGASAGDLDKDFVEAAARAGNAEMLRWLREEGVEACVWGKETLMAAVRAGCEEVLEAVAKESDGGVTALGAEAYVAAAWNGDLATLHCLRRLYCPWGPTVGEAGTFASCMALAPEPLSPLLRWLVEAGCPVDWRAAKDAGISRCGADWWRKESIVLRGLERARLDRAPKARKALRAKAA